MTEDAGITEVRRYCRQFAFCLMEKQPSLMNFCVTDGESVVATRYISSRHDEAASLVCIPPVYDRIRGLRIMLVVLVRDDL